MVKSEKKKEVFEYFRKIMLEYDNIFAFWEMD